MKRMINDVDNSYYIYYHYIVVKILISYYDIAI